MRIGQLLLVLSLAGNALLLYDRYGQVPVVETKLPPAPIRVKRQGEPVLPPVPPPLSPVPVPMRGSAVDRIDVPDRIPTD
jgi:hypothetical protein